MRLPCKITTLSTSTTMMRMMGPCELHPHNQLRLLRPRPSFVNSSYPTKLLSSLAHPRLYCSRALFAEEARSSHIISADARSRELIILGIETSCDDTAAAVVTGDGQIISEVVSSQAEMLTQYGGVFPKIAEEGHAKMIDTVVAEALLQAGVKESDLSAVAVTIGPGLSLCLRVGVRKARSIAKIYQLPWIGVHHMEAHALVAR